MLARAYCTASGDAIPRVSNRVFHLLPGRRSTMLVRVPVARQIAFDVVPVSTLEAVRRLVAVAVARLVIVIVAAGCRSIGPITIILLPVRVVVIPARTSVQVCHWASLFGRRLQRPRPNTQPRPY